jgi:hypothetical protein
MRARPVSNASRYRYTAGGYISTLLDKVDPNINIDLGNVIGITADWAVSLVTAPTGTSYIDLPVDGNGDYIFPDAAVSFTNDAQDFSDID